MSIHRRFPVDFFIANSSRVPTSVSTTKHQGRPPRLIVRGQTEKPTECQATPKFGTPQPQRVKYASKIPPRVILRAKNTRSHQSVDSKMLKLPALKPKMHLYSPSQKLARYNRVRRSLD